VASLGLSQYCLTSGAESRERSRLFTEALKDGAFDFMLSLSADVRSVDWPDPARSGLRQWLQRKAPALPQDHVGFSDIFQRALEDELQSFIEAFINNMPDVLRKLRVDEDEQRQLSNNHDHDLDLERFITTISYAFEGQPAAAQRAFWDSPDGAPLGFLHWASRRASTPLVSAFCEMLRALSKDEDCATSTHEFLLDDGAQTSTKLRRTHSLTWNQIFKELTFFNSKIRNAPAVPQAYGANNANNDHVELEPESFLMLECYLRLITRLCRESGAVRTFLRHHPSFNLAELLFQLAGSSIASRLKACTFACIRSLLSHKTKVVGDLIWLSLDNWIAGGFAPGAVSSKPLLANSAASSIRILTALRTGFEEPNAFVRLLSSLVSPYEEEADLRDGLPFPESLGSSSRMPGIDPYVDFALGQIFGSQTTELTDSAQARVLRLSCLEFITKCLQSFNEDLVVFSNGSGVVVDTAIQTTSLENYVLLHPFSRVMEWIYNETVMDALFASIQHSEREVLSANPDSPLILCLLKGIEAVCLILDLQPTYLDIVRPLLKAQSSHRRLPVANAAFPSFEDGVLNHLSLIAHLGLYCGSGLPDLVVASLRLLEKLSASSKLVSAPGNANGRRTAANKAIAALKDDGERISMILLDILESEIDINLGPQSPGHIMKIHVLDFLISCLQASPNQPSIGHLLLGFQCTKTTLDIDPTSPFNEGISLFHSILKLVLEGDVGETAMNVSPWLVSFKLKGLQVLQILWQSPLSSHHVMLEMRANNALALMFSRQRSLLTETFDDLSLDDPDFMPSEGAFCLSDFLNQRAITFQ
jgi:nuclear pore complex protein Nup205